MPNNTAGAPRENAIPREQFEREAVVFLYDLMKTCEHVIHMDREVKNGTGTPFDLHHIVNDRDGLSMDPYDRRDLLEAIVGNVTAGFSTPEALDMVEHLTQLADALGTRYIVSVQTRNDGDAKMNPHAPLHRLSGDSSSVAEAKQRDAVGEGNALDVCRGLGGVNTPFSWKTRGLALLDSDDGFGQTLIGRIEAWKTAGPRDLRLPLSAPRNDVYLEALAESLTAIDTEDARTYRYAMLERIGLEMKALHGAIEEEAKHLTFKGPEAFLDRRLQSMEGMPDITSILLANDFLRFDDEREALVGVIQGLMDSGDTTLAGFIAEMGVSTPPTPKDILTYLERDTSALELAAVQLLIENNDPVIREVIDSLPTWNRPREITPHVLLELLRKQNHPVYLKIKKDASAAVKPAHDFLAPHKKTVKSKPFVHPDRPHLDRIDQLYEINVDLCHSQAAVIRSLAGIDSDHAWELRYWALQMIREYQFEGSAYHAIQQQEVFIRNVEHDELGGFFAGASMKIFGHGGTDDDVTTGIIPRNRRQSFMLRERILYAQHRALLEEALTLSLVGLGTDEAWDVRESLFELRGPIAGETNERVIMQDHMRRQGLVLQSLSGIDSERAENRRTLAKTHIDKWKEANQNAPYIPEGLLAGLAGVRSEAAQALRTDMLKDVLSKNTWNGTTSGYLPPIDIARSIGSRAVASVEAARAFNLPVGERTVVAPEYDPSRPPSEQGDESELAVEPATTADVAVEDKSQPLPPSIPVEEAPSTTRPTFRQRFIDFLARFKN